MFWTNTLTKEELWEVLEETQWWDYWDCINRIKKEYKSNNTRFTLINNIQKYLITN